MTKGSVRHVGVIHLPGKFRVQARSKTVLHGGRPAGEVTSFFRVTGKIVQSFTLFVHFDVFEPPVEYHSPATQC